MSEHPAVLVVGGGVAGLVAARSLAQQGASVAVWEASDRLGGQVCTVDLEGAPVDLGAAKVPDVPGPVRELLTDLGLWDELVPIGTERFRVHDARGVRLLPEGLTPQGITSLRPMALSRTLGLRLKLRAACEPLMTRRGDGEDVTVAQFSDRRFGRRVTDELIAPVTWGVVGSRPEEQSLRAFSPALWSQWRTGRSVVLQSLRTPPPAPTMVSMDGGWRGLVETLSADLDVTLGCPAERLSRSQDGGFDVESADRRVTVRAVVLAIPDAQAAHLLQGLCALPSDRTGENPGTALGVYEVPGGLPAEWGNDYVLQAPTDGSLVRMANVVWRDRDSARVLLRVVGLVTAPTPHGETATQDAMTAYAQRLAGGPVRLVGMTHLRRSVAREAVGHHGWVQGLRAAVPEGIALAGSYYDGGGLNAVIGSGQAAAAHVRASLARDAPVEVLSTRGA